MQGLDQLATVVRVVRVSALVLILTVAITGAWIHQASRVRPTEADLSSDLWPCSDPRSVGGPDHLVCKAATQVRSYPPSCVGCPVHYSVVDPRTVDIYTTTTASQTRVICNAAQPTASGGDLTVIGGTTTHFPPGPQSGGDPRPAMCSP
jgi:hypothetical protein